MFARNRESRKHRRQPLRRAAAIVLQAASTPVRCVIWDMSDGGARLAIAYPTAKLPRAFSLLLTKDAGVQRTCEVVWTDNRFVGVRFISEWVIPYVPARASHIPSDFGAKRGERC
jgi:PilZ domain